MSVDAGSPASGTSREFPPLYYTIIRVIDGFSNITGKVISLTMLFLVLSITYEVVARYFFRAPTVWVFESSSIANGSAFMLGCAYALYKGAHVRTDIFWENYSERTKGIIDLVSYLVLFFPVMITMMAISMRAPAAGPSTPCAMVAICSGTSTPVGTLPVARNSLCR